MNQKQHIIRFSIFLVVFLFVKTVHAQTDQSIMDFIRADDSVSIFMKCLDKTELDELLGAELNGEQEYTLVLANDAAFDKATFAEKFAVWKDRAWMKRILQYHIVEGRFTAEQLIEQGVVETLEGNSIQFSADGVINNSSKMIETDIQLSNGVVHIIDTTLSPPR